MQVIKTNHPVVQVKDVILGEGMPKICLPVVGKTEEEILKTVEHYESLSNWDILEVRLDYYEGLAFGDSVELLGKIRHETTRPILATIRTRQEGGEADLDDDHYSLALTSIITSHTADMVDIEASHTHGVVLSLCDLCEEHDVVSIISSHNFEETPSNDDMREMLSTMHVLGGDILKLAVMPHDRIDVMRLMKVTTEMSQRINRPLITMSMGDLGKISRISGEITGSVMTFGTAGKASAPGQIALDELYQFLKELHCD